MAVELTLVAARLQAADSGASLLPLLAAAFCANLPSMAAPDQHHAAINPRRTVETWLRCPGLIQPGPKRKTKAMKQRLDSLFGNAMKRVIRDFIFSAVLMLSTSSGWGQITFTAPGQGTNDFFGYSVAAVGSDRLLIGARNYNTGGILSGVAFLFSTNGTLLQSFIDSSLGVESGEFGYSVATVGNDRLLIGAPQNNAGTNASGAAYLFDTNGTLLTVFTNPTPTSSGGFGVKVAELGTGRVLVKADRWGTPVTNTGAVYLFNTNGTLLRTFTSPLGQGQSFGSAIAAVGNDKVLIGAAFERVAAGYLGRAYLLNTNGIVLTIITNPTPAISDQFGYSAAALGSDRVVIGAPYDRMEIGKAYLFSTNGMLLTTFPNPGGSQYDHFGYAVAAVGNDRVLVGISRQFLGGMVHLFTTNGILLASYDNPIPQTERYHYGAAVTAVGNGQVLVGAYSVPPYNLARYGGAAFLFDVPTWITVPLITQQPQSRTVLAGQTAKFFAEVNGAPVPSLRWQRSTDGANTWTDLANGFGVSNATTTNLFISSTVTNQNGHLFRIAATNVGGGTASASATLTVNDSEKLVLAAFTNPIPRPRLHFGNSVAAAGAGRILVGAPDDNSSSIGGSAFLFTAGGALLLTLTNPTPEQSGYFGYAVAGLGTDRLLIGAPDQDFGAPPPPGAVYMFDTRGILINNFTNPHATTSSKFGSTLAALGNDRVVVGAYQDYTAGYLSGVAFLFSTNGMMLSTFTNPTPAGRGTFGNAVAVLGNDRILVGAAAESTSLSFRGAAYIFSTNGTLLLALTSPVPTNSVRFGYALATVGSDRLLVGAPGEYVGNVRAGAAYLFTTNGVLLTTFTNPTPASSDQFGYAVTTVDSDKILIGMIGYGQKPGAVFMFNTNGMLLNTFTISSGYSNQFGCSVAAVGNDRFVVGARWDDMVAADAGAAYLFHLIPYPPLNIRTSGTGVSIGWITPEPGLILEQANTLTFPPGWSDTGGSNTVNGWAKTIQQPIGASNRFYRLRRP